MYIDMGVASTDAPEQGSLSQGQVSRVCFGTCFAPLSSIRRTKIRYLSGVCFGCVFPGVFRKSGTSQHVLQASTQRIQNHIFISWINGFKKIFIFHFTTLLKICASHLHSGLKASVSWLFEMDVSLKIIFLSPRKSFQKACSRCDSCAWKG